MESRDLVSVSKVSGLVSVSKDFGLGLELFVSRLCIGYVLWSLARRSSLKNGFKRWYCSKFSRSKRSVAKLPLLCYLQEGENNFPTTPFKIYTEFNKKYACTNETAARNLCNERLGVFCKGLSMSCFSRSFVTKPIGLFRRGEECQKVSFLRSQMKPCLFSKCFSKHSVKKHAAEVFFLFCVMQTFLSSKMPRNSLEEKFCS